ncbi:spermatogenesis-associated serine-rich protein 2 isoform X2 [Polyodon spathula]|nr:spermatogenesis-associated serine-rich protein 2 isoform X2 [Polyodon spathula]XP_041097849.1 spermatogenesis-associated serine-rich protein 2 isoform X2 [Polyodon spathula]XP_041097850.1 spermatogenesis-associated serine-rich protein 2 isoform X2 [Polyodon spathula]
MVMSQGGSFEKMKEKIGAVRAVVPNRSNNEIVLVLQHYDNCVDRAVQSFVDGSAVDILKEWNVTGKKKPKKKKKKPKPAAVCVEGQTDLGQALNGQPCHSASQTDRVNGYHANDSLNDGESVDSLSEQLDCVSVDARDLEDLESATPELPDTTVADFEHGKPGVELQSQPPQQPHASRVHQNQRSSNKQHSRTSTSTQSSPALSLPLPEDSLHGSAANKKLASNIDKSVKDLQRCTASLTRYRVVVKEEMDCSIKKMKQTFAELQSCLIDREVALLAEMDKVKAEAMAILDSRQKKAEELRRLSEQAVVMSVGQLSELRADIKHFVSERKYDEDLGKALKFTYELEPAKKSIMTFGQVYHPQTGYSNRSRCSSVSSASLSSPSTQDCPPSVPQASGNSLPSSSSSSPRQPAQPQRQGYQGNRRPGQGYQPPVQRSNGALYQGRYEDRNRNINRPNLRYQNRAPPSTASPASPASPYPPTNGTAPPRPRQDQPNGLPQRPPRTHCPPPGP